MGLAPNIFYIKNHILNKQFHDLTFKKHFVLLKNINTSIDSLITFSLKISIWYTKIWFHHESHNHSILILQASNIKCSINMTTIENFI
jgi:hypothetical protein